MTPEDLLVERLYELRSSRLRRAEGSFDKAQRFYPVNAELSSCCSGIRSPTRSFPYCLLKHTSTRKHVACLVSEHLPYARSLFSAEFIRMLDDPFTLGQYAVCDRREVVEEAVWLLRHGWGSAVVQEG